MRLVLFDPFSSKMARHARAERKATMVGLPVVDVCAFTSGVQPSKKTQHMFDGWCPSLLKELRLVSPFPLLAPSVSCGDVIHHPAETGDMILEDTSKGRKTRPMLKISHRYFAMCYRRYKLSHLIYLQMHTAVETGMLSYMMFLFRRSYTKSTTNLNKAGRTTISMSPGRPSRRRSLM